jgi:hypothetical protein
MPVVQSERFMAAFAQHCPDIPTDTIPFLLSLNLGVAKNISGLGVAGPLNDWIERQQEAQLQPRQAEQDGGAPGEGL